MATCACRKSWVSLAMYVNKLIHWHSVILWITAKDISSDVFLFLGVELISGFQPITWKVWVADHHMKTTWLQCFWFGNNKKTLFCDIWGTQYSIKWEGVTVCKRKNQCTGKGNSNTTYDIGSKRKIALANVKARLCTNVTFLVCLLFLTYSNEVLLTITGDQKNKNAINV